jgi:RHS repeat-associated protein
MFEAARLTDPIIHTQALTGFLTGAAIGAALLVGAGFVFFSCGFGAGLLAGLLAGGAAELAKGLGEAIGQLFAQEQGRIAIGSHNVFINGLPAAYVTSEVACEEHPTTEHCDPTTGDPVVSAPRLAEGSTNVFINGRPAARLGDRTECDGVIIKGSNSVFIGGGRKPYLAIQAEVPEHYRHYADYAFTAAGLIGGLARIAGAGLAKKALPCAVKFTAGYLGGEPFGRYVASPTLQRVAGGLMGHPVEVTTGRKILLPDEETDFVLPGPVPYAIKRFYASDLDNAGALGRGWVLPWELRLTRRDGQIRYSDAQGRESAFPEVPPGHTAYHDSEQRFLACTAEGRYLIHDLNDVTHDFGLALTQGHDTAQLEGLGDGQGHWLTFHWHAGRCKMIEVPADRLILDYDRDRLIRITRQVDEAVQVLVTYAYDTEGQLTQITNANGHLTRQFQYENERLVAHSNALGFECRYRWAMIEATQRVVEASTTTGERWLFTYGAGTTQLQDDLGRTARWDYDADHQVTACTDLDGRHYRIDYDSSGHPTVLHLPGDRRVEVGYDPLGRPITLTDPLGRKTHTAYHGNSLRITQQRTPDNSITRATYDHLGRLSSITDALGREEKYDYPPQSPWPTTHTDARGGQQILEWNRRGQLIRYTDCSAKTTRYDYDALGNLYTRTDAMGQRVRLHWTALSELTAIDYPDGSRETYHYDAAGLLIAHTDTAGQVRRWQRNSRGEVIEARDPNGRCVHYRYDPQGRIIGLNRGKSTYQFAYDSGDRLTHEIRPDRVERWLSYDSTGTLRQLTWQGLDASRTHTYQYDAVGRLLTQTSETAVTTYTYDTGDRLTLAQRQPTPAGEVLGIRANTVSFTYDIAGRLLSEEGANGQVGYQYGVLDELLCLELPGQQCVEWLHYGSGHVHQIRCGNQVVTDIERDDLHREIERSQGRLTHRQGYDSLGRRLWQSAGISLKTLGPECGRLWRSYGYTPAGELGEQRDSVRGISRYTYDASGQLMQKTSQRGPAEAYLWDAAANLLDSEASEDDVQGNRLTVWQDLRLTYDAFGNLLTKRKGAHRIQRFTYDAEHRLLSVVTEDRSRITETRFDYDAFGRRIAVRESLPHAVGEGPVWRHRRFVWQGLRLVQEQSERRLSNYLNSPDDPYAPLARIDTVTAGTRGEPDRSHCWHFHTDALGTPLDVTDERGDLAWAGRFQAWGKVVGAEYTALNFEQPLRFPGQYADSSTGLHYNTFRYYDPDIGRYISQDPIVLAGGDNLYGYAPNPTGWRDPWGLTPTMVDPNLLAFSQSWISPNNYAEVISQKGWIGEPLNVIERDGRFVSFDNRRLDAARELGMRKVPVTKVGGPGAYPKSTTGKTWNDAFDERLSRNGLGQYGTMERPAVGKTAGQARIDCNRSTKVGCE